MNEQLESQFICTSNRGYSQQGAEELKRLFGSVRFTPLVPSETVLMKTELPEQEVILAVQRQEPMFIRHIHPVHKVIDISSETTASDDSLMKLQQALRELFLEKEKEKGEGYWKGRKLAVQARKGDDQPVPFSAYDVKEALDTVMTAEFQANPAVKDADLVVSVTTAKGAAYLGISKPEDNLSDWAGGAIRFRKEEDQISRAKFKLLEAEKKFQLDFGAYDTALDIGAAPGGWTSLLLERGLKVTAVDPAALHPSLKRHPKLTFYKKNAADVKFREGEFDLLVCDMSWSPRQMSKLVTDLLYSLRPGGAAIVTLKLMHKKAFQAVRETVADFEPSLHLVQGKQLFHNRDELTLYFIKSW